MKRWFENRRVFGNLALVWVLPGFFWKRFRLYVLGIGISGALYGLVMLFQSVWFPRFWPAQNTHGIYQQTFVALGVAYGAVIAGPLIACVLDTIEYRRTKRRAAQAGYRLCGHCLHDLSGAGDHGTCSECGRAYDAARVEEAWRWVLRAKKRRRDNTRDVV